MTLKFMQTEITFEHKTIEWKMYMWLNIFNWNAKKKSIWNQTVVIYDTLCTAGILIAWCILLSELGFLCDKLAYFSCDKFFVCDLLF